MSQRKGEDAHAEIVNATKRGIREEMDATPGLTRGDLLNQLQRFLRAKRKIVVQRDGEITDTLDVEDTPAQLRAWEHAMSLRQEFPSRTVTVDHTVTVESLGSLLTQLGQLEKDGSMSRADMMLIAGLRTVRAGTESFAPGANDIIEGEVIPEDHAG